MDGAYHVAGYDYDEMFVAEFVFDGSGSGEVTFIHTTWGDEDGSIPFDYSVSEEKLLTISGSFEGTPFGFTGVVDADGAGFTAVDSGEDKTEILAGSPVAQEASVEVLNGTYYLAGYDEMHMWNFIAQMDFDGDGGAQLYFLYSSSGAVPDAVEADYTVSESGLLVLSPIHEERDAFVGYVSAGGHTITAVGGFEPDGTTFFVGHSVPDTPLSASLVDAPYRVAIYDECGSGVLEFDFDGNGDGMLTTIYSECEKFDTDEPVPFQYFVSDSILEIVLRNGSAGDTILNGIIKEDFSRLTFVEIEAVHGRNIGVGFRGMRVPLSITDGVDRPDTFILEQNFPNPFNPSTTIRYSVPRAGHVTLTLYDVFGRKVRTVVNDYQAANTYTVTLRADDLASGLYYYKLQSGSRFVETRAMLLVK